MEAEAGEAGETGELHRNIPLRGRRWFGVVMLSPHEMGGQREDVLRAVRLLRVLRSLAMT
jgi:hypothetical protein